MLNSICDKIFVITTIDSDRVDYIRNHLDSHGVKFEFHIAPFFGIIDPNRILHSPPQRESRPSISLISAYLSIIESCRISGIKRVGIIEDDCFLLSDWQEKFKRFYNKVPSDWDILNLGYHPMHDTATIKEKISDLVSKPLNWHHTTHCMVVRNTAYVPFKHMLNHWNWHLSIDYTFNELYKRTEMKSYIPEEHIAYQLSYRKCSDELSYVKDTYVNFKSNLYNEI